MTDVSPPASWSAGPGCPAHRSDRTVLRVRSLSDLLSLVPVVLGFEPHESLVVAAVAGSRPGFHLRVDLPSPGRDDHVGELAAQVTEAVLAQGCTRVAVLGFTADVTMQHPLREVADALDGAGVEVVDVVRSDGTRYWSLVCGNPQCCPPEGVGYDPRSSPVRAEATLAGIAVAPDRAALAARLAPCTGESAARMRLATAAAEREVMAALGLPAGRGLSRPLGRVVRTPSSRAVAHFDGLLDRVLARIPDQQPGERADGPAEPTDAEAAAMSVWCSVIVCRDLAWSRIDCARARRQLTLWSAVASRVVPPYEPAVLSLAGFAAWVSGDGASAWCAIDRAQAADPDYSMARLLADALARCVPPDLWTPPPRQLVLDSTRLSPGES